MAASRRLIGYLLCLEKVPHAFTSRSMAGHSKWANIKFKKMHRDIARAKVLGKLHKEIITTVREDGPDPTLNNKLEHLIVRAKAANMTKEKIESAIKSGVKNTGDVSYGLLIEGHGPGGCGILIDTLTSNKARTRTEIRTIFTKNGGHVGDEGSVSFMYEHKAIFILSNSFNITSRRNSHIVHQSSFDDKIARYILEVRAIFNEDIEGEVFLLYTNVFGVINIENCLDPSDINEESNEEITSQAEELAIEVGAENVMFGRNSDEKKFIQFICAPNDLIQISNRLTKDNGCILLSANLEYLPKNLILLNDNQLEKVDKLLEKIMEHEDVIKTYDNVKNYPSDTYKYAHE